MSHEYWITTVSGGRFFYDNPEDSDISVEDVAHHLSNVGRFAGATRKFWSVAQHSVLVAWIILYVLKGSYRAALFGLLHDGHEGYINDIPTPFAEYIADRTGYDIIESAKRAYDTAIFMRLVGKMPSSEEVELIKKADKIALVTEASQYVKNSDWIARFPYQPLDKVLTPLSHEESAEEFISWYRGLHEKVGDTDAA